MSKQANTQPTNTDQRAASKSLALCGFGDAALLGILSLSKATFVANHGVVGLSLLCLCLIFIASAFYGARAIIEQTAPIRGILGGGVAILSVQVILILALVFYLFETFA